MLRELTTIVVIVLASLCASYLSTRDLPDMNFAPDMVLPADNEVPLCAQARVARPVGRIKSNKLGASPQFAIEDQCVEWRHGHHHEASQ
jgi:hypothetical protein